MIIVRTSENFSPSARRIRFTLLILSSLWLVQSHSIIFWILDAPGRAELARMTDIRIYME